MFEDIPCPDCHGPSDKVPACARCAGRGYFVAMGCPAKFVTAEARRALQLANWADRGFLPTSGGLDRQRHRDVRLIQLAWFELDHAQRKTDE